MKRCFGVCLAACLMMVATGLADTHYVSLTGGHGSPFTSWATAATNIQAAVDVAGYGDTVLVADGTYVLTGQITVSNAIAVSSVNGPDVTVVNGNYHGRCFVLGSSCSLAGFTILRGYGLTYGGGVYCDDSLAIISNCTLMGNTVAASGFGSSYGGGAYGGTLNNCTLSENSVYYSGGGASGSTLNNCTLSENTSSRVGGGASDSTLNNCTLMKNTAGSNIADDGGGGASGCTLNNCTLSENQGLNGGGASGSTLNYCTLSENAAENVGGGAYGSTLNYCTLTENSSDTSGGGAADGTLNNCTLTGNTAGGEYANEGGGGAYGSTLNSCLLILNTAISAGGGGYECKFNNCTISENVALYKGGGAYGGTLNNSISYYNGSNNLSAAIVRYSCAPDAPGGYENITAEPCFVNREAGYYRLTAVSPCINAGRNTLAPDNSALDGNDRILNGTVDMGAYEFQMGPYVTVNGLHMRPIAVQADENVVVKMQMNIEPNNAGALVDWWVVALAGSSFYYMNNSSQWTQFDGKFSNCHPAYQGALGNVPDTKVLNMTGLPIGSYTFWFAVDLPMDGILNLDGPILLDSVNVNVQ